MDRVLTFQEIFDKASKAKRHVLPIPEYGGAIEYEDLDFDEFMSLYDKNKNNALAFAKAILAASWKKTDDTVTAEKIVKLPGKLVLSLVNKVVPDLVKLVPLEKLPEAKKDEPSSSSKSSASNEKPSSA